MEGNPILPIVTQASILFMIHIKIYHHIFCYHNLLINKLFIILYYIQIDPYIFSFIIFVSVPCYRCVNSWLFPNQLTDGLMINKRLCSLNIILGHLFNNLGCFLLDLLPYRNKSDSLPHNLLFPRFKNFSKISQFPEIPLYKYKRTALYYRII